MRNKLKPATKVLLCAMYIVNTGKNVKYPNDNNGWVEGCMFCVFAWSAGASEIKT